jgi:hypothetical protein
LHKNDFVFEKKNFNCPLQVIYAIFYMLPLMGYPPGGGVLGYSCDGITTVEANGEGYLYPSI